MTELTERDRSELMAMLRWWRSQGHKFESDPARSSQDQPAPDVYLALTPAAGIPAATDGGSTGSGDAPGCANCQIYKKLANGTLSPVAGLVKSVCNWTYAPSPCSTMVKVSRDKFGTWWWEPHKGSFPAKIVSRTELGCGNASVSFSVAGLTDDYCNQCSVANRSYVLPQAGANDWRITGGLGTVCSNHPPQTSLGAVLVFTGEWELQLTRTDGTSISYLAKYVNTSVGADWNTTTMVLSLSDDPGICNGWPATITVTKQGTDETSWEYTLLAGEWTLRDGCLEFTTDPTRGLFTAQEKNGHAVAVGTIVELEPAPMTVYESTGTGTGTGDDVESSGCTHLFEHTSQASPEPACLRASSLITEHRRCDASGYYVIDFYLHTFGPDEDGCWGLNDPELIDSFSTSECCEVCADDGTGTGTGTGPSGACASCPSAFCITFAVPTAQAGGDCDLMDGLKVGMARSWCNDPAQGYTSAWQGTRTIANSDGVSVTVTAVLVRVCNGTTYPPQGSSYSWLLYCTKSVSIPFYGIISAYPFVFGSSASVYRDLGTGASSSMPPTTSGAWNRENNACRESALGYPRSTELDFSPATWALSAGSCNVVDTGTGTGGDPCTVTVACCANPIPCTLTLQFTSGTGNMACLVGQTVTLTWNGSNWNSGVMGGGGNTTQLALSCISGTFSLQMTNAGLGSYYLLGCDFSACPVLTSAAPGGCEPFNRSFLFTGVCGSAGGTIVE